MLLRLRASCKRRGFKTVPHRPPRQFWYPLLPLLTDSPPSPPSLASPKSPNRLNSLSAISDTAQTTVPSPQPHLQNDRPPSLTDSPSPSPPSLPHRQSFSLTSLSASPNSQLNKTLGSVKEKESERNKDGFYVGQEVRLIFGKKENLGLKGMIVKRLGSDSIVLRVEKSGDPVLVLYGKHKGAYGNLVQRGFDREVGVVQDYGSHDLDRELIDSPGEYCRHPRWRELPQFKDQKQHIISYFQWKREIREVKLPV